MTAVVAPQVAIEIFDKVAAAPDQEPRTLDRIATDYGLTLTELRALLARRRTPIIHRPAPPADEQKACSKCNEVKPLTEFFPNKDTKDGRSSWCRTCNSRKRNKTPGRVIEGRARGRAYRLLALAHPEEFERLFAQETAKATVEHEQLVAAAEARGHADAPVARLKTGPKRREQTSAVERLDVARCPKCHRFHDAGHQVDAGACEPDPAPVQLHKDGAA